MPPSPILTIPSPAFPAQAPAPCWSRGGFPSSSAPRSPSRCSHSGLVKLRLSTPASVPLLSPLRAPWGPVPAPLDASHPTPSSSRFSKDYIFSSGCLPSGLSQAPRCVSSGHLALILCTYPSRCLGVHAPGCDSLGAPHHRQTTAVFSQLCIFDAWHGAWHGIDAQQSFRERPCASSALLPLCRQTPIHPSRPSSRLLSPELLRCVLAELCTLLFCHLLHWARAPGLSLRLLSCSGGGAGHGHTRIWLSGSVRVLTRYISLARPYVLFVLFSVCFV